MGGYIYLSFVLFLFPSGSDSISSVYLSNACNTTGVLTDGSLRLEPRTSLSYNALTSCYYRVEVNTGSLVFLVVSMFDLESKVNGACVDYVNVHDGGDTSATTLNSEPMCGLLPTLTNRTFTSTGNEMTIYFHSDGSGQPKGFSLIIIPVRTGACSSSEITCVNTSLCVDVSLQCNSINECGDSTDEAGCTYAELQDIRLNSSYGLIIGLVIGITGFLGLVALVAVKLWRYYRWHLYVRKPMTANLELQPTTYETAYPITRQYYKDKYHTIYEDPARQKSQLTKKQAETMNGSDNGTVEEKKPHFVSDEK